MKIMKKVLYLFMMLIIYMASTQVFAVSTTQDGLLTLITTDKEEYNKNESIATTLSVTNTNSFDVTNVSIESIIPEGYILSSSSNATLALEKLKAGETQTLTVTYVPTLLEQEVKKSEQEIKESEQEVKALKQEVIESEKTTPSTGDSSNIILWVSLAFISATIFIYLLFKKKKKILSMFIAVFLVGSFMNGTLLRVQATENLEKIVNVQTTVNIEGKEIIISGKVGYIIPNESQNQSATELKIDTENIGSKIEEGEEAPYYEIGSNFDGTIHGTVLPNVDNVISMEYTIKDSKGIEVKKGIVDVAQNWTINNIGLVIGYNTITVNAILNNSNTLTDTIKVASYNADFMSNIEIDKNDDDGDGLNNYLEQYYGTDKNNPDTDGDGLSDYIEVAILNDYDPLNTDSDKDGILDGEEDYDGDNLSNVTEIAKGTDLAIVDTDFDGLKDDEEIKLGTDPTVMDTDKDGANDSWEIENEFNPLVYNETFNVNVKPDATSVTNTVTAGVEVSLEGKSASTLNVSKVDNNSNVLLSESISGYLGNAYEFSTSGSINNAKLIFNYDVSLGNLGDDFQPRIYYFNETNGTLEELPNQTVTEGRVEATVSHFSVYILINKVEFDKAWEKKILHPLDNGEGQSINIAFVIDSSATMQTNDPNQLFKLLSKGFISKLRDEKDEATVVKFTRRATVLTELTKNKEVLYTAIDNIFYDDGHSLYSGTDGSSGLKMGLEQLKNTNTKNKYIIFITDGEDTYSKYSYQEIINDAKINNVKIYTVGMGNAVESTLKEVADSTGGKYYFATTDSSSEDILNLDDVFSNIQSETVDLTKDSNEDGIPDYFNDLIFSGDFLLSDGSKEFKGINFNYNSEGKESNDYDGDGLKNGEEINIYYDSEKETVYAKLLSSPIKADTDGDGLKDSIDNRPLEWDVSDRDLAMFSALCYEDGEKYEGKFYDKNLVDEKKHWNNYASIDELSPTWKIANYVNIDTGLEFQGFHEKFSATTYVNGNNYIIAFRGTNEVGDWIDNILGYGAQNYHTQEGFAKAYIKNIYEICIERNENAKLYVTGHSLGGYLAQIGTAELLMANKATSLVRTAYFNGIGMCLNNLFYFTKVVEVDALKAFGGGNDRKLISYSIDGDVVSKLGTHYGVEVLFTPVSDVMKWELKALGAHKIAHFLYHLGNGDRICSRYSK